MKIYYVIDISTSTLKIIKRFERFVWWDYWKVIPQEIKENRNFVWQHLCQSVTSDNGAQTSLNQFKSVQAGFNNQLFLTLLMLLLWSQLKSIISDTLSEISEQNLSCHNYWLSIRVIWTSACFCHYNALLKWKLELWPHHSAHATNIYSFCFKN